MTRPCRVLLVSGSLRAASTNTAMLRTAAAVAPPGIEPVLYAGLADLPAFNPDDDGDRLPAAVAEFRRGVHAADALVFSTPEYAGALPGAFKNLLDWAIGDAHPRSIAEKPVAWINVATRGAVYAHESLRRVLGYASATVVEEACVHLPITGAQVGADGLIADEGARRSLIGALAALGEAIRPA